MPSPISGAVHCCRAAASCRHPSNRAPWGRPPSRRAAPAAPSYRPSSLSLPSPGPASCVPARRLPASFLPSIVALPPAGKRLRPASPAGLPAAGRSGRPRGAAGPRRGGGHRRDCAPRLVARPGAARRSSPGGCRGSEGARGEPGGAEPYSSPCPVPRRCSRGLVVPRGSFRQGEGRSAGAPLYVHLTSDQCCRE